MKPTERTYCPRLWKEVFIKEEGDVYSCCHELPASLGNIYQDKLIDIYNNELIKKYRQDSLDGKLKCYKNCNLLTEEEFINPIKTIEVNIEDIKRLKIQFGEKCNINCIMCYQSSEKRNTIVLDYNTLIANIDLTYIESIEIQGGEPLFIKEAKDFFDFVISCGKKASFLTNGMILTDLLAEKIVNHSDFFYVSLNAGSKEIHEIVNKGSNWELVLKNISKLKELRDKCQSNLILHGHYTIIPENLKDIPVFIEKFEKFGFDKIDFGYDFKLPFYFKIHPIIKKLLRQKIREAYNNTTNKTSINELRLRILGLL